MAKKIKDCGEFCKALYEISGIHVCHIYGNLETRKEVIMNSPIYIPLRHKSCNHIIRTYKEFVSMNI